MSLTRYGLQWLLRAVALSGTLAVAACAATREARQQDVVTRELGAQRQPVIVIPGILGSGLVDTQTGRTVWPPNLFKLLRGWRVRDLTVPLEESPAWGYGSVVPTDVVLSGSGRDYYGRLVDTLTVAGFTCATPDRLSVDTDCVLFTWDWRQGFVAAAGRLEQVIGQLRAVRGDPDLTVDLVAHSAGAMIARYYVRFAGTDVVAQDSVLDAPDRDPGVRQAILIGPPIEGSQASIEGMMRGYRIGPITVRPDILSTFETSFQLLPHPELDWLIDTAGASVQYDLYDIETWRWLEQSIFDPAVRQRVHARAGSGVEAEQRMQALEAHFERALARGRRFHEALSSVRPDVDYLVVGGDCAPTPRRALLETIDGRPLLRFDPGDVAEPVAGVDYQRLMIERGDGRVTWSSLLGRGRADADPDYENAFHIANLMYTCAVHSNMAVDFEVRHNLLNLLFR